MYLGMGDGCVLAGLSDDELIEEVVSWAARVAAGEARLLALIGELDERGAWGGHGILSCAHWLTWRCGMGRSAARERVRVARALRELPVIAARFGEGAVTWTQVRAITRVCTAADERTWLTIAEACSGAQIEKLVQAVRLSEAAEGADDPDGAPVRVRPSVRTRPDGRVAVTFVLEPEETTVVLAAFERVLDEARADAAAVPVPDDGEETLEEQVEPPMPQTRGAWPTEQERQVMRDWSRACFAVRDHNRAVREQRQRRELAHAKACALQGVPARPTWTDALLRMTAGVLDAPGALPLATKERLRVCLDPLSGWARTRDGALLPPGPVTGDFGPVAPVQLTVFDKGRTMREVPLALRRLLGQVDGERCRMPGCTRTAKLHAHHVRFWSLGGRTDLANLILVCSRHHTLIHAEGFQLTLHPDRTLDVRTADDVPVLHHPALRKGNAEELPTGVRITTPSGDRLDLDYAVWVLRQHAA